MGSTISKPLGSVGDTLSNATGISLGPDQIKVPGGSMKTSEAIALGAATGILPSIGLLAGLGGVKTKGAAEAPSIDTLNKQRQADLLAQEASLRERANAYAEQLAAISEGRKLDPAAALQQQMNLSQQIAAAKANKGISAALAARNITQAAAQAEALQGAANLANAKQQYGSFLGGQQQLALSGVQGTESIANQQAMARAQMQAQVDAANRARSDAQAGILGSLAGAGIGAVFGGPVGAQVGASAGGQLGSTFFSDENMKKDIKNPKNTPMDPESFLNAIAAHSYKYKDDKNGKGTFLSPMAQELEKAGPVGKSMVIDTPEGKMVDYGRGFGAILAAQADLNKRLQKIEGKKG